MTTDRPSSSEHPSEQKSALEQRAQNVLQSSAEGLDGQTRSRLTQARHAALDVLKQSDRRSATWWLPASTAAAAAVLTVMVTMNSAHQPDADLAAAAGGVQSAAPVDELEIVTAEDSLEFYRDVEFYAWLDMVLEEEPTEAGGA
jgi:hypothetical protein